jgi:hypothetical protein
MRLTWVQLADADKNSENGIGGDNYVYAFGYNNSLSQIKIDLPNTFFDYPYGARFVANVSLGFRQSFKLELIMENKMTFKSPTADIPF